jgi:16S rRNA (guanine966-N2)-methyltransferase
LTLIATLRTMALMGARSNQVRIIGGQWRGRKLTFPNATGLRPTSDRMRETLFNWLTPVLHGAHCLDLFAGSGALGFEAASRGAARVVLVECDPHVASALRDARERLAAHQVEVIGGEARNFLAGSGNQFDVVFLDPPFSRPDLLEQSIESLQRGQHLADGAYIYVEAAASPDARGAPLGWELWRNKRAGAVSYRLYRFSPAR